MARRLTALPKLPTSEDIMKKIRRKAGLPRIDRRKKQRLTIDQINMMGDEQLRQHLAKIREPADKRTTFTKVMDVIDIPRNIVANVIGSLAGVKNRELPKGALGIPRVMASDVLKKLGVKNKVIRAVAGFGLDVAADPLLYASLGAATGLKIGKGLPRMLKPGTKLLKRTAQAMTTGGRIPRQVAKAIPKGTWKALGKEAGTLIAKFGRKSARKRLMARRGGILSRALAGAARGAGKPTAASVAAAQGFLKQFGMKGRTILRAPFAAKGLAVPFGKQARIFKELGGPKAVREAMRLGRAGGRLGKKAAAAAALTKEAALAGKGIKETEQAKKLIRLGVPLKKPPGPTVAQLRAKKAAAEAASAAAFARHEKLGSKIRSAAMDPRAPEVVKGMALEKYGRQLLSQSELAALGAGPVTRAKHALISGKRQLFGGPVSEIAQQEQAAMASLMRGPAAGRRIREPLDPVIETLVKRYGVSHKEIGRRLTNLAWAGSKEAKDIFPGDVVLKQLAELRKTPFPTDPDVLRLLKEGKAMREGQKAAQVAKGVYGAGGEVEGLGRHLTKQAEAFKADEAKRVASTGFHPERERMVELAGAGPQGPDIQYALGRGPEKAKLIKAGYTPGKSYPISREHWNAGLNPQTGKPMAQRMIGPGTPQPQVFITDFAEQAARDASSHQYKMSMAEFRDNVMRHGAWQVPQAQAAATPWQAQPFLGKNAKQGALYQLLGPDLAPGGVPLLMDRPVAEMIDRMNHVISSPEAVRKILHSYDIALGYWKTFALYHPGYIIRNIFQNILGTAMGGGQPLRMIRHATKGATQDMLNAIKAGKPVTGIIQTRVGPLPAKMVAEALLSNNHIGTGFSSMLHTPSTYERMRRIFQNKALGLSFRTNQVVEDSMKAGAFINFLEQGMSVRQASMALAKSMPDLTMLTTFERSTMRRVFPFFSWYRRNGALQLFHYLPKYPAWAAAGPKLRSAVQMAMVGDQAVDAQLRPSWQEEAQATQIMGDSEAGSVFLMGSWLPFDDMVAVLGAAESPQDFMREMLERASPVAKFGAEMAVGVDIFRQRPIPKFTPAEFIYNAPKAIIGKSGSPLDNLLGIRPAKEYLRRVWEQPTVAAGITRGLIGGAIQPVSRERGLIAMSRELRDKAQVLRAKLNRAVENRDQPEIQLLTRELMSVWAQMMQRGLPGVPKAAQAMMAKRGIQAAEPALSR